MAVDLMISPNTRQTLEHDLESFFWVLLWIVLKYVPCSWDISRRSDFIYNTMNPKVYGQTGGYSKKRFLTSDDELRKNDLQIPTNKRLRKLLIRMKTIVAARHRLDPEKSDEDSEDDDDIDAGVKTSDEMDKEHMRYIRGLTFLKDHVMMFRAFKKALRSDSEWPTNDLAMNQGMIHSTTTDAVGKTGSKRSRSLAEQSGIFSEPSSSKRRGNPFHYCCTSRCTSTLCCLCWVVRCPVVCMMLTVFCTWVIRVMNRCDCN
jgi:hypothetical protein